THLHSPQPDTAEIYTLSLHDALPISTTIAEETNPDAVQQQSNNALRIHELLPDPVGTDTGQEWVELLNTSSLTTHLNGWTLTDRSEEHTSELQSRENLVCRLLLEKKK